LEVIIMAYVTPSTVSSGDAVTAAAHNIIVNDIINHESRLAPLAPPRGVMAYVTSTATNSVTTTETVYLTSPSFTAVAGRLYKLSSYDAGIGPSGAIGSVLITTRIRLTNASGTVYGYSNVTASGGGNNTSVSNSVITTLAAGSTVIVHTAALSTGSANRGGGLTSWLLVEDIGPA
jgi:hypothetical protein